MTKQEFGFQLERLRALYGDKAFAEERIRVMMARYLKYPYKVFVEATDWVVLMMPTPGGVISILDEKLSHIKTDIFSSKSPGLKYECEPCRDFGYGWIGDTLTRCICENGKALNHNDFVKVQRSYDNGARFMPRLKEVLTLMEKNQ